MKPTFTMTTTLTVDGEPDELLDKLSLLIENKFYEGRVDGNSVVIKESGRGFNEKWGDQTQTDLVSTIEGQIHSDKRIRLMAELNSGPKFQAYLIRTFIIFFGIAFTIESFDWFYSTLTLLVTTAVYLFNNTLIRKRVKRDLDTFIWTIKQKHPSNTHLRVVP